MSRTASATPRTTPGGKIGLARAWAGVLAGPLAATIQVFATYPLAWATCRDGGAGWIVAVSVGCLALAVAGHVLALREREHPFIATLGRLGGIAFTLLVLAQAAAALALPPCP